MKLLTIMLFALVVQLEAGIRAQVVNIKYQGSNLRQVFFELKKQTGYDFFYTNEDIAHTGQFSIHLKNRDLESALEDILQDKGLSFEINNKAILIKRVNKRKLPPEKATLIVQETIRGLVIDSLGSPISGVTITVRENMLAGTRTDVGGRFELKIDKGQTLLFSSVGYMNKEIVVADFTSLRVVMQPTQESLDEIVVVGYGTQRKIQTLGSQSSLSVADLKQPVANITTVLAGRVSGLVGVQRSGEPGLDGAQLWVRGVNTLNSGLAHPLILVDGVERDFNNLDPNDIESFTILKDASSTSVYGVRGANGVILITTKKGVVGDTQINVEYLQGITEFTQVPKQADGVTYMQMANEALVNRGQIPLYSEEAIRKTYTQEDPYLYPNVNWMDEIFNNFGNNRKANLNIRGGSDKMRYYVSAGLYNEDGLFKTDNLQQYNAKISFDRYNFTSSLNIKATKTTDIDLGVKGYITNGNYPGTGTQTLFQSTFDTYPIIYPVRYPNGEEPFVSTGGGMNNPYYLLTNRGYVTTYENQLMSDIHVKQKLDFFTKGLSARVLYSFDALNENRLRRVKSPSTYYATGRDENGELIYQLTGEGEDFLRFERTSGGRRQFYLESSINYNRAFGDHTFTGLFLFNQSDRISASATDLIGSLPYRSRGVVGRLSYSFADRYLAEVSFGYNGAENFAPDYRYGLFPSYAVGWVPSNEVFWKPLTPYIQKFKIRGSYGKVGSSTIAGRRFAYIENIGGVPGYFYGKARDNYIGGLDITEYASNASWEIETNYNIGLELSIFQNALSIEVDYFDRQRENIFLNRASVPSSAGFRSNLLGNLGVTNANGVDASANFNKNIGQVSMMVRGTFTYNRNKVIENDQPVQPYAHLERRGHAINQRFGYIVDGFYTQQEIDDPTVARTVGVVQAGDLKFRDLNGDGLLDAMDHTAIGKSDIPQIVYGFGTTLGYKGFSLGAFFQGIGRADFYMSNRFMPFLEGTARGGLYENILDRWTEDNPRQDAFYPRLSHGNLNQNYSSTNSHWLMDGSFLRLKTLEFGYTLPKKLLHPVGVSNTRIYFMGYNLWTLSPFKMYDPELGNGDGLKYPNIKTYSLGLNFTF